MIEPAPIQSILLRGNTGRLIDIECSITNGLPNIIIIGLGNKIVHEAKERIRNAFLISKLPFPRKRITLNLAPADIPKESTSFDLAMAVAIMVANKQLMYRPRESTIFIGEVSLDGTIRSTRGIIGQVLAAKRCGITTFYIPYGNLKQVELIKGINLMPVHNLRDLLGKLNSTTKGYVCKKSTEQSVSLRPSTVFKDVIGQDLAKRALLIAAAGGHNILLSGPPGTGKSMLARSLINMLPALTEQEILEVTHLHSLADNNFENLITARPFRAPHHSASRAAILGGGLPLRPGEISLGHRGVLLLDEMPEFPHTLLESLRQPLEDKIIAISRAHENVEFPADFLLIGTANPCPCGYYGTNRCTCSTAQLNKYKSRISGPIMDRIDLCVTVDQVDPHALLREQKEYPAVNYAEQVKEAREAQMNRLGEARLNTSLTNEEIKNIRLEADTKLLLTTAAKKLNLSARTFMRTIKVAQTIADLAACPSIKKAHIAEALQYRNANMGSE